VPNFIRWWLLVTFFTSGFAVAQPFLHLKTRRIDTTSAKSVDSVRGPKLFGRRHLLLQFNDPPSADRVAELKRRGVAVLADVPENGLLVSVERRVPLGDLGVRFAGPIEPADKLSPLAGLDPDFLLVEFHPDVDIDYARGLVLNLGIELHENPDLGPHQLMIHAVRGDTERLARLDDVAYIFPASKELVNGVPVRPCAGAITTNGGTSQMIPTYGPGWDGPGLGAATLSYVFSKITSQLPPAAAQAEIQRAMAEWSRVVQVTWQPGKDANAKQTVNILFASGAHGDGFPFDGPGGVVAHTFYPAPPNPEPIAGDMHFDDSESWRIGANTDLFSVALHELGHALGLGHSDNPNAVMYPYYRMATALSDIDRNTVLTLYAAQGSPAPPPGGTPPSGGGNPGGGTPIPLTLNVNAPPSPTGSSTINLSGAASGGTGPIVISWSTDHGASGTAQGASSVWTISNVPLAIAVNTITVTATAGASSVSRSITVTRQTSNDATPPALTITSPASATISTPAASLAFSGTAADNVGVTLVTWSTNTGSSGTATGTTSWTAVVPVLIGSNVVTIRASDAAGNVSWRTAVVARH
jgi:hypothetical protein